MTLAASGSLKLRNHLLPVAAKSSQSGGQWYCLLPARFFQVSFTSARYNVPFPGFFQASAWQP